MTWMAMLAMMGACVRNKDASPVRLALPWKKLVVGFKFDDIIVDE